MPIIKSAKKALRQNIKRRKENLRVKNKAKELITGLNEFRSQLDKTTEKITGENIKEIQEKLRLAYKAIDKAAKKRVFQKNTASRKKSNLAKKVNALLEKSKK